MPEVFVYDVRMFRENTLHMLKQQKAVGTRTTTARTIVNRLVCYVCSVLHRDVPDIRFRLAGYPAIFSNSVTAPILAKMVPGTEYLSRIVLSPFCAFRASLKHCRRSHY